MRLLIAETSLSEDITTAANMLFFTVVGDFLLRLLLRKRPEPTDNEITATDRVHPRGILPSVRAG